MGKIQEVAKRDALERVNYLYQAAHFALCQKNFSLSRFYSSTLCSVVKKSVLKLDTQLKRTLCKGCCTLLLPGVTCTIRLLKRRNQSHQIVTCLQCHSFKRYPFSPSYQLWSENPNAWIQNPPVNISSEPCITSDSVSSDSSKPKKFKTKKLRSSNKSKQSSNRRRKTKAEEKGTVTESVVKSDIKNETNMTELTS